MEYITSIARSSIVESGISRPTVPYFLPSGSHGRRWFALTSRRYSEARRQSHLLLLTRASNKSPFSLPRENIGPGFWTCMRTSPLILSIRFRGTVVRWCAADMNFCAIWNPLGVDSPWRCSQRLHGKNERQYRPQSFPLRASNEVSQ